MTDRHVALVLTLVWAVSACHSTPPKQQPVAAENSAVPGDAAAPATDANASAPGTDEPKTELAEMPPCVPTPKPVLIRKPKPAVRTTPPPPAPVAAPPPPVPGEASVKLMPASSVSILGRKVRALEGDDLGRVVDVLADAQGRVRIAIIEFGGFLGVGNRRIAVEWGLLKFRPEDPDAPVIVNVSKRKLQETPEYKGSERPLALMAPEAPASPPPTTPK